MREISPERQAEFNRLHGYIAGEVVDWVGMREEVEVSNTDLLAILNRRATREARASVEWPKEAEHICVAVERSKQAFLALGFQTRRAQRGRKPNGKKRRVWCFKKA